MNKLKLTLLILCISSNLFGNYTLSSESTSQFFAEHLGKEKVIGTFSNMSSHIQTSNSKFNAPLRSIKPTSGRRAFYLNYICDPGGIRTPNRQSRNLIFYPVELRSHFSKYIIFSFDAFYI